MMTWGNFLTVLAILLAPLIALRVSRFLDKRKEDKARRLDVFRTLMATRAAGLSPQHVEALNRIDIEFYGDEEVLGPWKVYHDHLTLAANIKDDEKGKWDTWTSKTGDLLTNLLFKMAKSLGYKFDEIQIKRGHHYPKGYAENFMDQLIIRRGLVDIFVGKKAFPVLAAVLPQPEKQKDDTQLNQIEGE